MKWDKKESGNFEDRRGMSGGGKAVLGGGIIGIIVLLLNMFGGETGQTIGTIIEQTQGSQTQTETTQTRELSAEEKEAIIAFLKTLTDEEYVKNPLFYFKT